MRLLILFISFLISQVADSQIISASPPYRVRASGCATKLLDAYSGAAAAYSLRKLDADYAGSAIRVRRSSDNTEQDIGFVGCGDLDTAALKTFVGTGGTDNGFVVTWYDQSGNSRNATQATGASQPLIMSAGATIRQDGLISIVWIGGQYLASSSSAVTSVGTHSEFFVFKQYEHRNNAGVLVYTPAGGNDYDRDDAMEFEVSVPPSNLSVAGGASTEYVISATGTSLLRQLVSHVISSGSGELWQNGTSVGTDTDVSLGSVGGYVLIGARYIGSAVNTASYGLKGTINEIVIYNSAQSANRTGIQTNINTYWQVY